MGSAVAVGFAEVVWFALTYRSEIISEYSTITGLITGLATAAVAWLWQGNPYRGLVINLGTVVNLFAAGLVFGSSGKRSSLPAWPRLASVTTLYSLAWN